MDSEVFIINGLTEGQKAKHARIAKGLRQIDLACLAKVSICEVTALEKDRYIRKRRKEQILAVLGLSEPEAADHA